jgi:hypothetical protein
MTTPAMQIIFRDGRWSVVLRVAQALATAGIEARTDTSGINGTYSIAVDMRERMAAQRIIQSMELR